MGAQVRLTTIRTREEDLNYTVQSERLELEATSNYLVF